jgi:hypothetical protein
MLPTTMSEDSNSVTKDSQTVELGGVYTGDETELARMGYKQELKCVQFISSGPRHSMLIIQIYCQA